MHRCVHYDAWEKLEPHTHTNSPHTSHSIPLAHPKCDLRVCRGCAWTSKAVPCDFIFTASITSFHCQNENAGENTKAWLKSRFFMERHGKTIAQVEFEEWWIEWIVCISLVNIKDHDLGGVQNLFCNCKTPYSWHLLTSPDISWSWQIDCHGFPKQTAATATSMTRSLEAERSLRRPTELTFSSKTLPLCLQFCWFFLPHRSLKHKNQVKTYLFLLMTSWWLLLWFGFHIFSYLFFYLFASQNCLPTSEHLQN